MKIIIILFLILILLYLKNFRTIRENYTAKIPYLKYLTCGNLCKHMYGCAGFAHNSKDNICYLSNKPINNKPFPAQYYGEFKPENIHCNKLFTLLDSEIDISEDMLLENSIYSCHTNYTDELGLQLFEDNNITNVTSKDYKEDWKLKYELKPLDKNREMNWEDLPRKELKYNDDNTVTIDLSNIKNLNNKENKPVNLQVCRSDIPEDKCNSMCDKDNRCKYIKFTKNYEDINNICCLVK